MPARRSPPIPEPVPREKLLAAASALFVKRGYAATSVREIVEAAGVTKPVLYYHFGSKEGIYHEILRHVTTDFVEKLGVVRSARGTARARIERLCLDMLTLCDEHADFVRFLYSVYFGPPQGAPESDLDFFETEFRAALREAVEEGIRSGELRRGEPDEMSLAILGAVTIAVEIRITRPDRALDRAGLHRLLSLIFEGLSARKEKRP